MTIKHLVLIAGTIIGTVGCRATNGGSGSASSMESTATKMSASDFVNTKWTLSYPDPTYPSNVDLHLLSGKGTLTVTVAEEKKSVEIKAFRMANATELADIKRVIKTLPVDERAEQMTEYKEALSLFDGAGNLIKVLPIYPTTGRLFFMPIGALSKIK